MRQNIRECAVHHIKQQQVLLSVGRVDAIAGGTVQIVGLGRATKLGDHITVSTFDGPRQGEVVRLMQENAFVLLAKGGSGVAIGDRARHDNIADFAPHQDWIGRVVDPDGRPLDGRPLLPGSVPVAVEAPPPAAHQRRPMGARLETGFAVFNTLLPIVRGQRVGLFAGSGVGKSTLLGDLALSVKADVIVVALVGERGREVQHFIKNVLGDAGMSRSVVIAATSDQPPQLRRRCALSAMAVAEYFRDQGLQVLLLVDSVTRFCEAHRELAVAGGEAANLRGFPASTGPVIAGLCERAGPGVENQGDITAVFSVLVAGSDMEEPVADMLRGVLDGHIVLEREIAERGRFPAVDVLRSVSRSLPAAASEVENKMITQARTMLGAYDRAAMMIQSGLYVAGTDDLTDKAIACFPSLDEFLTFKNERGSLAHFAKLRQALVSTQGGDS